MPSDCQQVLNIILSDGMSQNDVGGVSHNGRNCVTHTFFLHIHQHHIFLFIYQLITAP